MIVFSTFLIGYGVFRILRFKPVLFFDDTVKQVLGSTIASINHSTSQIKSNIISYFHSPALQKEIEKLRYDLRLKDIQLSLWRAEAEENKSLRLFLKLKDEKEYKIIPCDIIARDLVNSYNFEINKGLKDGLKVEQGIVYPLKFGKGNEIKYQLVGRIQEINQHSSRILSLYDSKSKISCRNLRNNTLGNLMYDFKKNLLYLTAPKDSNNYNPMDIIVTSDLSSLPKNLIIGVVIGIEPTTSINQKIIIATSIDFMSITMAASIQ